MYESLVLDFTHLTTIQLFPNHGCFFRIPSLQTFCTFCHSQLNGYKKGKRYKAVIWLHAVGQISIELKVKNRELASRSKHVTFLTSFNSVHKFCNLWIFEATFLKCTYQIDIQTSLTDSSAASLLQWRHGTDEILSRRCRQEDIKNL